MTLYSYRGRAGAGVKIAVYGRLANFITQQRTKVEHLRLFVDDDLVDDNQPVVVRVSSSAFDPILDARPPLFPPCRRFRGFKFRISDVSF